MVVASVESSKAKMGREIELNTRIDVGGSDGFVPHHFFAEKELRGLFQDWDILSLKHYMAPSEVDSHIQSASFVLYGKK